MRRISKWLRSNKCIAALSLLAMALILTLSAGSALAYFTTYASAKGGYTLTLGDSTEIREDFDDWVKHVQVENTGELPCYVRVKLFAGSEYTLEITPQDADWVYSGDDGYWYYKNPVAPGGLTSVIDAAIHVSETLKEDFDVAVVQECVPVSYNADGTPVGYDQVDWAPAADTGKGAGQS